MQGLTHEQMTSLANDDAHLFSVFLKNTSKEGFPEQLVNFYWDGEKYVQFGNSDWVRGNQIKKIRQIADELLQSANYQYDENKAIKITKDGWYVVERSA